MVISEITFELTDYCPYGCPYCSSNATKYKNKATFLDKEEVFKRLRGEFYDIIILSGGEPLSHPDFYEILEFCKSKSHDTIVYTNALNHICYNANVIDGIYLETNLTVLPNVDKIHILKRVEQGREMKRPEVHFSKNFTQICKECGHHIIRPDGKETKSPCDKWSKIDD